MTIKTNIEYDKYKYGLLTTAGMMFVYSMGFKRYYLFYNFFKRPSRIPYFPYVKKFVSTVQLFNANLLGMEYVFNQKLQADLLSQGFFTKYNLYTYFGLRPVDYKQPEEEAI